jgi:hypothetical protein
MTTWWLKTRTRAPNRHENSCTFHSPRRAWSARSVPPTAVHVQKDPLPHLPCSSLLHLRCCDRLLLNRDHPWAHSNLLRHHDPRLLRWTRDRCLRGDLLHWISIHVHFFLRKGSTPGAMWAVSTALRVVRFSPKAGFAVSLLNSTAAKTKWSLVESESLSWVCPPRYKSDCPTRTLAVFETTKVLACQVIN